MDLDKYKAKIREFANERDWDQFHDPKNLSMALSAEIGELLDVFQWLTSEQSKNLSDNDLKLAKEELGDKYMFEGVSTCSMLPSLKTAIRSLMLRASC